MIDRTKRTRSIIGYALACVAAIALMLLVKQAEPGAVESLLDGSVPSVHLLIELVAVVVASLVVVISWHTFDDDRKQPANVLLCGFLVVAVCDLMHALTYKGMPRFIREGDYEIAIFFWLMGRSFEVLTLLLIALGAVPRVSRNGALAGGVAISAGLIVVGNFYIGSLPHTFVEGVGVTPLKARYEYVLSATNLVVALLLARRARKNDRDEDRLLAMSCFMMAVGGLAFTSYVRISDVQNVFGHVFKVVAYLLLYRATFIASLRAPYEAVSRSEAQLSEYSARVKTLSDNLPQSVLYQVVGGRTGPRRFTYVSEASERILGLSPEEMIRDASTVVDRIAAEDQYVFRAEQRRAYEAPSAFDLTVRFCRNDGLVRRIHFHSAPRGGDDGQLVFDGIATDVTERIEAEEARRHMEAALNESQKLESLGTLASGIAHEFNNILGSIIGNVSLVLDAIKRGAAVESTRGVQQIHKASVRARDLVKQILTFSHRQAAGREVLALRSVVADAIGLLQATLPANIQVHAQLDEAHALADKTQIQQAVLNLCTNAAQAIGPKGGRIDVGITEVDLSRARADELGLPAQRQVNLWVADDGFGMDDATQRRIFEPFFTTKSVGSGSGLGLSVVHSIVQAHEGAIALKSEPGQGARFDIYLPRVDAPVTATAPVREGGRSTVAARAGGERVMYVDDDELMAMMIEGLLANAGYAVTSFPDAQLAIEVMRNHPEAFDIVVTDFNMPTHSGLDVIRAILEIRPGLPTLLSTGFATDAVVAEARSLGVAEVLEKEHSPELLPGAIRRALNASPLRAG